MFDQRECKQMGPALFYSSQIIVLLGLSHPTVPPCKCWDRCFSDGFSLCWAPDSVYGISVELSQTGSGKKRKIQEKKKKKWALQRVYSTRSQNWLSNCFPQAALPAMGTSLCHYAHPEMSNSSLQTHPKSIWSANWRRDRAQPVPTSLQKGARGNKKKHLFWMIRESIESTQRSSSKLWLHGIWCLFWGPRTSYPWAIHVKHGDSPCHKRLEGFLSLSFGTSGILGMG